MNKQQNRNYYYLAQNLIDRHDMKLSEVDELLRIEKTLKRWSEEECNGTIQRNDDTGKPFRVYGRNHEHRQPIADREAVALKRAQAIAKAHGLTIYHQGDPRGCSLYLLRPGDIREGATVASCYTNGIAIYI